MILDLRHIDGGVPGGEERRGADGAHDFAGQCVHVIAEHRASVRIGVEVEVAASGAQFDLHRFQEGMAVDLKGVLARPHLLDNLQPRILAGGMDADEPPAGPQRPRQRTNDLLGLELG